MEIRAIEWDLLDRLVSTFRERKETVIHRMAGPGLQRLSFELVVSPPEPLRPISIFDK
jgi:hypothetical protein